MTERQESLWRATRPETRPGPDDAAGLDDWRRLKGDLTADVVVVGAGLTGLTAAVELARAGRRVVVLEAGRIGDGTTGGTTAHITVDYDHDYDELERVYGLDMTQRIADSLTQGDRLIERHVRELGIACDYERVPGFQYTEDESGVEAIERGFATAQRLGLPVTLTRQIPLPFRTVVGYELKDQAQVHALGYLAGLARAARRLGVEIYEGSRVVDFDGGSPCYAATAQGSVEADHLVLATHTPLGRSPLHAEVVPVRSYALAIKIRGKAPHGLFWDTAEPYHYIRSQRTDDGTYVIVGGADRKTAHGSDEESFADMARYVAERFDVETYGYRWAAQFYDPLDHLAFIGPAPIGKNVYVATGFSGDGWTLGTLAGWMIARQIGGEATIWDDLYRPTRIHLEGAKRLVHEAIDMAKSFVGDRLTGESRQAIATLASGQGVVVGTGQNKVAAFRDDDGRLHAFSAVCPHMACIVRWNESERSFDCPCHGSRFTCAGAPIEGPTLAGLAPLSVSESRKVGEEHLGPAPVQS